LEGLKRVADLVKRGRLKVSYEEIEKAVEEFDEAQIIMRRLREAGIIRA